jgi:hypothetical protein
MVFTSKSAGEICTVEKAKELGVYDTTQDRFYRGLEDMRTYTSANPNDYKRKEALCRINSDGDYAFPLCPIQHGFAFTQMNGDPSRCVTHACPPTFTEGSNYQCLKPDSPIFIPKKSACEEKSYDWYTIPYYHLGNGYRRSADGKCFRPCSGVNADVPLVKIDPVDKNEWVLEFTTNTTKTDGSLCTSIKDYMNGKYGSTVDDASQYCPVAVAKRLSVTTEKLQESLKEEAERNLESVVQQLPRSAVLKINSQLAAEAVNVAATTKNDLKNLKTGSRQMKIACERMITPEEVGELYPICKDLKTQPSQIINGWKSDDSSLTTEDIRVRRTIMEQACHEVFCNNPHYATQAGGEPICFDVKKVGDADLKRYNERQNASIISSTASSLSLGEGDVGNKITARSGTGSSPDTGFVNDFSKKIYKTVFLTFLTITSLFMFFLIIRIIMAIVKQVFMPYETCSAPAGRANLPGNGNPIAALAAAARTATGAAAARP